MSNTVDRAVCEDIFNLDSLYNDTVGFALPVDRNGNVLTSHPRDSKGRDVSASRAIAAAKNRYVYNMVMTRNMETAFRRYKIKNLSEGISERVVLWSFWRLAGCCFFVRENGGQYALPFSGYEGYNINGDPLSCYVYSRNGEINEQVGLFIPGADTDPILNKMPGLDAKKDKRGVIIWENKTRFPFANTTAFYANSIADGLRTMDVARLWIKRPFVIACKEDSVSDVYNMLDAYKYNEEEHIIDTGLFNPDNVKIQSIDGSGAGLNVAKENIEWYNQQYREACNMRSNTQSDKKGENLTTDEVHFNEDFTDAAEENIIDFMNEQFKYKNEMIGGKEFVDTANPKPQILVEKKEGDENDADISGSNR